MRHFETYVERDVAFEEEVRDTADFMWAHAGRPEGREIDYWNRALEACLRRRQADIDLRQVPPPISADP